MDNNGLRATYRKRGQYWEGVLKCGASEVWRCGHCHHNRDQSTKSNGTSAVHCANTAGIEIAKGVRCFFSFVKMANESGSVFGVSKTGLVNLSASYWS